MKLVAYYNCFYSTLLPEILVSTSRDVKEVKKHKDWKEIIESFIDNMIVYRENAIVYNPLELRIESSARFLDKE